VKFSLFWQVTQTIFVVNEISVHFGPILKVQTAQKIFSSTAWLWKMGLTDCPETSVNSYQFTIPKERKSHLGVTFIFELMK
jgi:hypothetical protein